MAETLAVLGTLSGLAYSSMCLWSAGRFRRQTREDAGPPPSLPPVSILKPLRGIDRDLYQSFRSHCLQDYPQYELIFGVSQADDPATALVDRLRQEFPQRDIKLLVCSQILGTNVKISNLAQMVPVARYDYLVVNDSDIRVPTDYLRKVVPPLLNSRVGMTTCLYRGVAAPTLGSRLESLGISTDFAGGVLVARELEGGMRFALGSTLAFRRQELEDVGGFEALVDYLADDYELGARISSRGPEVELSPVVVETFLPDYSLLAFGEHQLRWARSVRDSRPWGYFGLVLTFAIPWSVLTVTLAQGTAWAWTLLSVTLALRLTAAAVLGRGILKDRQVLRLLWLVPLRDFVALFLWAASYAGHKIRWRGEDFYLKDGKLARR